MQMPLDERRGCLNENASAENAPLKLLDPRSHLELALFDHAVFGGLFVRRANALLLALFALEVCVNAAATEMARHVHGSEVKRGRADKTH
jgi:hypothetical protein